MGIGKVQMTDGEIALRRDAALKYASVLKGKNRNEIVIAYRQHGLKGMPSRLPMYAKHSFQGQDHLYYKVIDRTGRELGQKITLNGQLQ